MNPFGENFFVKPDGKPLKVALALNTGGIDWVTSEVSFMQTILTRGGATFSIHDAAFDVNKQTAVMEDLISAKSADVIIVQPVNEAAVVPSLQAAKDAGIPTFGTVFPKASELFVNNSLYDYSGNFVPGGGSDIVGKWYSDYATATGKKLHIYEVWGQRSNASSQARHEGFHKGLGNNPLITVTESADSGWDTAKMGELVMDAFSADPTLNAIFQHGAGATGVIEGLRSIGKLKPLDDPQHILFANNEDDNDMRQAMDDGYIDAMISNSPVPMVGSTVMNIGTYLILGQDVQHDTYIPNLIVTPENSWTLQQYGVPALWPRLPQGKWDIWPVPDLTELGIVCPNESMKK
jgi:ABC-type sugar transport system substrate-binding protein